jgi:hypothetical protein
MVIKRKFFRVNRFSFGKRTILQMDIMLLLSVVYNWFSIIILLLTVLIEPCGTMLYAQINPRIPIPEPTIFKPIPLGHSHDPSEFQKNYRYNPLFNRPDPLGVERERRALQEAELQRQQRRQAGVPLPSDLTEEEKRQQYLQREGNRFLRNLNQIYADIEVLAHRQNSVHPQYLARTNQYKAVSQKLETLVTGAKSSLKEAVFLAEQPLWNEASFTAFDEQIKSYAQMVRKKLPTRPKKDQIHQALFRFFRDTTFDDQGKVLHLPIRYDFNDYWGAKDHKNLHVLKLLAKNTGQCRSMPLLYKLLASELGVPAWISYAPNHSFIIHTNDQGQWFFLETTSLQYVPLSVYTESGFIRMEALRSGIYLDTLSDRQLIASLWTDLASDYYYTVDMYDDANFVKAVCQKSLKYYPNNIRAHVILHNIKVARLRRELIRAGSPSAEQIRANPVWREKTAEMVASFERLMQLGFEPISKEAYDAWLRKIS